MAESGGTSPGAEIWREARISGRMITWAVLRVMASIVVVMVLYYLLPFDRSAIWVAVALYFTVTVFSTVGFGDITAKTGTARLVVTGQMIADLVILGLAIKVIVGAVRRGRQRQPQDADHEQLTKCCDL
jgi:hypothetical protein